MTQLMKWWFPVLIAIIAVVAVYDTVLIVLFRDTIRQMERNPVGVWLIEADRGSVGLFVFAKVTGTIIVIATLFYIRHYHIRRSVPITTTIALWQTLLFGYLTFA